VNTNEPAVPAVVLSNLACKGVIMIIAPLTLPVVVAAIAILMLPIVEVNDNDDPASTTKSSPASPLMVMVLVPVVALMKLIAALFTSFICPHVMLPFASTVTGPVAGVLPPTLLPSNTRISVAPVDEGLELPEPSRDVFQFVPVVILVLGVVPPTQ
jgi:hypothetical protein